MSLPDFETLRLPFHFCPNRLHKDIDRIQDDEWVRHFNTDDYDGDWNGVALRGPAWATHPIQALIPAAEEWVDTPVLERCQYFAGVLDHFKCPLLSVRLLRLGVGSVIKEHTDYQLSLEDGEVRIHIPVVTNPGVEFFLNGKRVILREGEAWYLNFSLPHRIANRGSTDRIHLVVDCTVNEWLLSTFKSAAELS